MSLFHTPSRALTRSVKRMEEEAATRAAMSEIKLDAKDEAGTDEVPKSSLKGSNATHASSTAQKKRLEYEAAAKEAAIAMEVENAKAEAAVKIAEIQRQLVRKQLEADIANIDAQSRSSRSTIVSQKSAVEEKVEDWMNKSMQIDHEKVTYDEETQNRNYPPSKNVQDEEGNLQSSNEVTDVRNLVQSTQNERSDFLKLAEVLREVASSSAPRGDDQLLSRLATSKDLPYFFGDPMEWLQFKEAFYESTRLCKFSDTENVWRLRKCLRGEAKESVSSLLIGNTLPQSIIDTLELRFGRPENIMSRIAYQIKKLQPLPLAYHTEIIKFSIKIKNFVTAASAINQTDYLQSPELVSTILTKLPTALITKWADYAYENQSIATPKLVLLADFLYQEANKAASSGVSFVHSQTENVKYKHELKTVLLCNSDDQVTQLSKCLFCRGSGHTLGDCKRFKRALRKDRWNFARAKKLCYKCLGARHQEPSSCPGTDCDIDNCGLPHHYLLHWVKPRVSASEAHCDPEQDNETVTHTFVSQCSNKIPKVLLKIVPVTIYGPKGRVHTHALLDDGATITLIAADIANKAGLHGETVTMRARSAWDSSDLVCQTEIVNLDLTNSDGERYNLRARKMNELNLPVQNLSAMDFNKYDFMDFKCMCGNIQPKILIGQDNYDLIAPILCIQGDPGEPYFTKTHLGWCVHGVSGSSKQLKCSTSLDGRFASQRNTQCKPPLSNNFTITSSSGPLEQLTCIDDVSSLYHTTATGERVIGSGLCQSEIDDSVLCCFEQCDYELNELVRRSFTLDSIGISNKPRQNADDILAMSILDKTSELVDGHWVVGLPWKHENNLPLPLSYVNACNRLKTVQRKMARDKDFSLRYQDRINHLFTNNYGRELSVDELITNNRIWYLPHFGVYNPNKKKLRLVFDAAAKSQGYCINDFLLQGPDLLQSLYGIMLRFRENPVGIIGDIKDMFLRIKIREQDQHALRFLWQESNVIKEYVMTSLIFGANCSPFIAQYINKNKNASRFETLMPTAVNAIYLNQYADDYIDSLEDENSAKTMIKEIIFINQQGGFEMRNWMSNCPSVLSSLPKEALSDNAVRFKVDCLPERTLGLLWFPADDEFAFDLSLKRIPNDILLLIRKPTKRELLSIVMSIFDVHGFLNPFIIKAKILIRETWKLNIKWDQQITDTLFTCFSEWVTQLKELGSIRIPRWYFRPYPVASSPPSSRHYDVTSAAAAALLSALPPHVGNFDKANTLQLHLFCDASPTAYAAVGYWRCIDGNGKAHVSFIASKSRVAPSKLITIPRLELQGALLACRLADSIKNEHRLKPDETFYWTDSTTVLHWIRNVHRNYKVFIANRLGEIDDLSNIRDWHYVPTEMNTADLATKITNYKLSSNCEWFSGPPFLREDPARWPLEPETKNTISNDTLEIINNICEQSDTYLPIPDPTRFSSWLKLQRTTATVLLFIEKCKKRKINFLNQELMKKAEVLLLRNSQERCFKNELNLLKQNKSIKRDSRLLGLSPIFDANHLLRVQGRIEAVKDVALEAKHPIILDGRDHTARLIVRDYHVKAMHAGNEFVVNELRQKYWVLRLRPTVRTIASQCLFCRIKKSMPEPPKMGNLPEARMTHHSRPFTICGLDLFGPIEVTIGRQRVKRYGVLFTCLTVRAVHIEVVASLTADSLIMALRRMAARRGWPQTIYSDNGTNMRGAESELIKSFQDVDLQALASETLNRGVQWCFIPPVSPHMGGAWERLIKSVKTALKVVLKERAPKEEVLITLLAEVENMINSRPLTHVSVDPKSNEALTPNHFLIGSSSNLPLSGVFDDADLYLRKQWRNSQRLADLFWGRWMKEFLPTLIPRKKWLGEGASLKKGDIVVIVDPSLQRNHWPKGIIENTFPGSDGRVRVVSVKTAGGVMKRPATRVAKLFDGDECRRVDTGGEDVEDGSPE